MRRDRGAAALEMALVLGLLCTTLTITAPLAQVFQRKIVLERVAGSTARFATRVAGNSGRYGVAGRRPTFFEVIDKAAAEWNEVAEAWNAEGATAPINVLLSKDPATAHAGELIEVTASTDVDLGLLGSVLSFAGITDGTTVTVTAKAVGRQE
jgi:Flp pilus assembly protein TadG